MTRRLLNYFSFRSYWVVVIPLGVMLAVLLLLDRFQSYDVAILAAYAGGALVLNRRMRLDSGRTVPPDVASAKIGAGRPTLLQFHSDQCAACMVMKSVMDGLEHETGDRLQVLRIDLGRPEGRALAEHYKVSFSPTFILFDSQGRVKDEMVFVLSRARVLYWLEH